MRNEMKIKTGDILICERCGVKGIAEADDDGTILKINNIGTEKHPCLVCDECYDEYKALKKTA
jgi:hypothetical protein